jgi:chromosome partitioning protein
MTRTISLINNKGGVGKTTSTLNIGKALSLKGKKVLLVDIDPQGNLTDAFININALKHTIKDLLEGTISDINEVLLKGVADNIDLIPSNNLLNGTEENILNKVARETLLKRILEPIKSNYDYILIDCPPSLNLLVLNSLTASTEAIIPIATEYHALTGTNTIINTIGTIKEFKKMLGENIVLSGVFITKYDERTNNDREIKEAIQENFKNLCYKTIIRTNVKIKDATNNHKSVIDLDPTSNGALDYMQLADEIINQEKILGGVING